MADGPLAGIRVLEFSMVYAAPWAGMNLSDLGADVIKVEAIGGEPTRNAAAVLPGVGGKMFTWVNRGKRSLSLNLRDERAQAIVHRLTPSLDVVLINYRPGQAKRYRIDYDTLSKIRPELVYAEITGFGYAGPQGGQGSTDIVAQSYSGMTAAVGKVDPFGAPWTMNIGQGDIAGGGAAVLGITSALYAREATGRGQLIEVSLLRSTMGMIGSLAMRDEAHDRAGLDALRERLGSLAASGHSYPELLAERDTGRGTPDSPYYASYETSDGAITLGCLDEEQRARTRRALAIDDGHDARERLREVLRSNTVAHWLKLFDAHDVPAAPVLLPELIAAEPQAEYLLADVHHEMLLDQRQIAPLVELSKTPTAPAGPSSLLGQHTDAILQDLGYSADEIAQLHADGVVE